MTNNLNSPSNNFFTPLNSYFDTFLEDDLFQKDPLYTYDDNTTIEPEKY